MILILPLRPRPSSSSTTFFITDIVVVRRADMPMTPALSFSAVSMNFSGADVVAQIDDLEPCALQHDPYEVLSDVVKVTLNRADHDFADGRNPLFNESGFSSSMPAYMALGRQQDLREEHIVVLETFTHHVHSRDESVIENLLRRKLLLNGFLGQLENFFIVTGFEILGDGLQKLHLGLFSF